MTQDAFIAPTKTFTAADSDVDDRRRGSAWDSGVGPGDSVGRYAVGECVGAGGTGLVFRARDEKLDRDVALKFLRPELGSERRRARLMAEARAMAQLRHTHVVAVYDVGEHAGHTWVAMEYVEGTTLRALTDGARPWAEISEAFVGAARGLAAAHAVGIVHRDFKPENVLVDPQGIARVADFGLAFAVPDPEGKDTPSELGDLASDGERLTRTGTLLGTPRYMAPEQFANATVTASADQFAFCVALYEALYGEAPFEGKSLAELAANVGDGKLREQPSAASVPGWLRDVVLRGLSPEPGDRFASMDAVIAALGRDPAARRRRLLTRAAAVAGAGALAGSGYLLAKSPNDRCETDALATTWNDARASVVRDAITSGDETRGAARAPFVVAALERYAAGWRSMYEDACRATHELGEQSDSMLDLRTACLQERAAALEVLVDALTRGEAEAISSAETLTSRLPSVSRCADTEALASLTPLPEDPERRAAVLQISEDATSAHMLNALGKYDEAVQRADACLSTARELDYAPALAKALMLRGMIMIDEGRFDEGEALVREAVRAAARGRDDKTAALAWIFLVSSIAADQHNPARARQLLPAAQAAAIRAGGTDPTIRFNMLYLEADLGDDDPETALPLIAEAEALVEANPTLADVPDARLAALQLIKARILMHQREWEQAKATLARCTELYESGLGAGHPSLARPLDYLGTIERMQAKPDAALPHYEKALAISNAALGAEHPFVSMLELQLSYTRTEMGDRAAARAHAERALEILTATAGPDDPRLAESHVALGLTAPDANTAIEHYTAAIEIKAKQGDESMPVPTAYQQRAEKWTVLEDWDQALADFEKAKELFAARPRSRQFIAVLVGIGRVLVLAGRPGEAIAPLQRAAELNEDPKLQLQDRLTRFYLGRALVQSGDDKARGRELIQTLRKELAAGEDHGGELGRVVETWAETGLSAQG